MKINPPLIAIFFAALVVRAVCVAVFYGEIDTEGSEYARIAQNIAMGNGYSGIVTEGAQLIFPPLFPLLIASLSFLLNNAEAAGRILSVASGALLIFPVYLIGCRLFGRKIALGGAALVALHPYLVFISTGVNCEPTYFAILFTAIYVSMRLSDHPGFAAAAAGGVLYGLAYLVRQEGLVFMVVALAFTVVVSWWRGNESVSRLASRLSLMPVWFLVFAAPYIAWISVQTGQLRIEAKSPLNIATELRMQDGLSLDEAAFAVSKDALPAGVWNQPNIDIIKTSKPSAHQLFTMVLKKSVKVFKKTSAALAENPAFGTPALLALAIIGLITLRWSQLVLFDVAYLTLLMLLSVLATFFIYYSHNRFYVFPLVVLCIWASAGLAALRERTAQWAARFRIAANREALIGNLASAVAIAALILPSAASAGSAFIASRDTRTVRAFAAQLAASGDAIRVADSTSQFAFHAGAKLILMPYCDEQTALKFLHKQGVTHVVVDEEEIDSRPYLSKWMEQGVPDSQEIALPASSSRYRVRLFRFG